jgi:hypothetical protein
MLSLDVNPKKTHCGNSLKVPPTLIRTIRADPFTKLRHLQLHDRMLGISVSVVLDKEIERFLSAPMGHKPPETYR